MTRNQIEYLKVKMTGRELEETRRHNLVSESLTARGATETERHNLASEELTARGMSETERHNLVVEDQSLQSIQVARSQAAASMLGAQASMAAAAASALNAQASMMQAQTAAKLEPYQEMVKVQEANTTRQQGDYYHSQDLGQRLVNQYYGHLTESVIGMNQAKADESIAAAGWDTIRTELYPKTLDLTQRGQDLSYQGSIDSASINALGRITSSGIQTAGRMITDSSSNYSNTYVDMGNGSYDRTSSSYFWP